MPVDWNRILEAGIAGFGTAVDAPGATQIILDKRARDRESLQLQKDRALATQLKEAEYARKLEKEVRERQTDIVGMAIKEGRLPPSGVLENLGIPENLAESGFPDPNPERTKLLREHSNAGLPEALEMEERRKLAARNKAQTQAEIQNQERVKANLYEATEKKRRGLATGAQPRMTPAERRAASEASMLGRMDALMSRPDMDAPVKPSEMSSLHEEVSKSLFYVSGAAGDELRQVRDNWESLSPREMRAAAMKARELLYSLDDSSAADF